MAENTSRTTRGRASDSKPAEEKLGPDAEKTVATGETEAPVRDDADVVREPQSETAEQARARGEAALNRMEAEEGARAHGGPDPQTWDTTAQQPGGAGTVAAFNRATDEQADRFRNELNVTQPMPDETPAGVDAGQGDGRRRRRFGADDNDLPDGAIFRVYVFNPMDRSIVTERTIIAADEDEAEEMLGDFGDEMVVVVAKQADIDFEQAAQHHADRQEQRRARRASEQDAETGARWQHDDDDMSDDPDRRTVAHGEQSGYMAPTARERARQNG